MRTEVNWFWNADRFAQLFNYNKKDAYLYAKSCWIDMSKSMEWYKPEWDKEETNEERTLEEMKKVLKENWIDFHVNLWKKKIKILLEENWL